MKDIDMKVKIFSMLESIGLAFKDLYFIIYTLNHNYRNLVVEIIKNALMMACYCCREFYQRFYSRDPGFIEPIPQITLSLFVDCAFTKIFWALLSEYKQY